MEELDDFLVERQTNDFKILSTAFCGDGLKEESITRACYNVDPRLFQEETVFPKMREGAQDGGYPYHFSRRFWDEEGPIKYDEL